MANWSRRRSTNARSPVLTAQRLDWIAPPVSSQGSLTVSKWLRLIVPWFDARKAIERDRRSEALLVRADAALDHAAIIAQARAVETKLRHQ